VASIRDRATFVALRRAGRRRRSGPVSVTALVDDDAPTARVAYALNRSVGTAVARNRLRRRLREVLRSAPLAPGAYLVSASASATALSRDELVEHVKQAVGPAWRS